MNVEQILSTVGAITTAITTLLSVFLWFRKNKNAKIANLSSKIIEFVKQAEQLFSEQGQGVAKLEWVLNKVQIYCLTNSLKYNEENVKKEIETILETPQKKEN